MNLRAQAVSATVAAKPPFRAEHIGSLLRPANLLRERARFAKGEIDAALAARHCTPAQGLRGRLSRWNFPGPSLVLLGRWPGKLTPPDVPVERNP